MVRGNGGVGGGAKRSESEKPENKNRKRDEGVRKAIESPKDHKEGLTRRCAGLESIRAN